MQTSIPPTDSDIDAGDPLPLAVRQSPLWRWATPALSVALLGAIVWQLFFQHKIDLNVVTQKAANPLLWIALLAYWAAPIVADFIIYRRLWGIPFEGMIALSRKQVGNALLVDLIGEAYFYGWARRKLDMATSPFGAVKDVTILSAMVGNAVTLVLMAIAWPYLGALDLGVAGTAVAGSIGLIVLVSILVVVFGNRLFSLSKGELWWVAGVHLLRVLATTGLIAVAWALFEPKVAFGMWALLATAKLMASRLPLFVNSEVIFANIVIWFLGKDSVIEQVVGVVTILILVIYLVAAAVLAVGDLIPARKAAKEEER
ncbi:hypothetical protein [Sphingomonas sp. SUN039]|uniref:hypothetical protein n=1 Tax=Sphingomonas sp. SUN039 TaxID=2937787 RepID=UPI0021647CEE|nr:hypothetical protein [Sphingomonas sp. SUN039]UVO55389.1 hypothetical protein M0209_15120 [Sphingomonas sp. SUN039]